MAPPSSPNWALGNPIKTTHTRLVESSRVLDGTSTHRHTYHRLVVGVLSVADEFCAGHTHTHKLTTDPPLDQLF